MPDRWHQAQYWGTSIVLAAAIALLAFGIDRTDHLALMLTYTVAMGALVGLWRRYADTHLRSLLLLGVGLRLMLVFALPPWSDDYFRFVWDGRLVAHGIHPFLQLPTYYSLGHLYPEWLPDALFSKLNSPTYYTVYPPVLQALFGVGAWLSPHSIYGHVIVLKLFLLLAECVSLYALWQLLGIRRKARKYTLLYALNPLVLLEVMGNLHFEGLLVTALLVALWALHRHRYALATLALAIGIATKLLPLMLLPFFIPLLGRRSIRFFAGVGATTLLLFAPLLHPDVLAHLGASVQLYFGHFEFNGSLYYLLRQLGYWVVGYNAIHLISPALSLGVLFGIIALTWHYRHTIRVFHLPQLWLLAFALFYACATTVHPWYIITMIALMPLTRLRFPWLWSLLIVGTYLSYRADGSFAEPIAWIILQYLLLGAMIVFEWRSGRFAVPVPQHDPPFGE